MFSINPIVTPFPYCHKGNITFMTTSYNVLYKPYYKVPFPYCHKDNITFMTDILQNPGASVKICVDSKLSVLFSVTTFMKSVKECFK